MKIPWEKEGGKTKIVCVYLRGEVAKEGEIFFFFYELPPLLAILYIALLYIDGLACSL